MALNIFLKLEGVDGESTVPNHVGEILVDSFSWGATNSGTVGTGGGGSSGKVQFQDLSLAVPSGLTTAQFLKVLVTGKHEPSATLTVYQPIKGKSVKLHSIKLSDVLISSFSFGAAAAARVAHDSVSLSFIKLEFTSYDRKGTAVTTSFDPKTGA